MNEHPLFSWAGCQDPFRHYADLLAGPPVVAAGDVLLASHHEAVLDLLRDPRFGHAQPPAPADETLSAYVARTMFIRRNPPEHTHLRGLVARAFTPRRVRDLRPSTEAVVDRLLDDLTGAGTVDLIEAFAAPLPVTVIADLLCIPESDRAAFRGWSEQMVLPEGDLDPAQLARADSAAAAFCDYLVGLVDERRRHPGDDLVSDLVGASDADPEFGERDVIATCELLLFAGHETTVNLIGNGVLSLVRDGDAMGRMATDDGVTVSGVEELLRFDGPVHLTARTALTDAVAGGVDVPEGALVIALLGAANRDPRRFARADELVLDRPNNQHVGFGFGIHFCLGAPLARMEAQLAVPALLRRFPSIALATDALEWRHSLMLRGLTSLPVTL